MEKPFDFTKKLFEVHKPSRIRREKFETLQGVRVTDGWKIVIPSDSSVVVRNAAYDLQEYFKISMECDVTVDVGDCASDTSIYMKLDSSLQERSFRIEAGNGITISGVDERALAQGCYALEDEMNLNEVPVIEPCNKQMQARFSPRMIKSCVRDNYYPDELLRMIAHAGIDYIEVDIDDVLTDEKQCEFINDIIERAVLFCVCRKA